MKLFGSYPIKFVWSLTKEYLKEFCHSSVVIFVLRVIGFISPLLTMILIDDVLPHSKTHTLAAVMLAMAGLYIIETILNTLVDWMMFSSFARLSTDISTSIFDALFRLPFEFFTNNRTGDTVSKILSSNTLRTYLSEKPMKLIMDLFFGIAFLFFLIYLSSMLTFIAVITVPMDFFVSYYWTKRRQKLADHSVVLANDHNGTLVESVGGAETIYQMDAGEFFHKIWFDEILKILRNSISLKKTDTVFSIVQGSIGKISYILMWWYGMYLIINGELKLGQFIAFTSYVGQLTGPIISICELWKDFQTTAIAVDKLKDIVTPESTSENAVSLPAIKINAGEIEIRNLSFGYQDENLVLDNISLNIKPREKAGIVGPSGCGKTTFVNLLQRLHMPTNGSILIDGQDISLFDSVSLRKCFGIVSQTGVLFKRSITENITLGFPEATKEEIIEAAVCAGAHEFISKLSIGYETLVEERGSNFSAGQCQRIMIARAVIRKPKIFIFDEATAALDQQTEEEVLKNLFEIAKDSTVIMISHQNAFRQYLDRVVEIKNGKIA
ncbi:MAG: peptidase domain-containing ABC transporter [Holosporaceae bacterium]|jgi:subfamily B ATP-binding cassette protein HlyB/CyaB|nr:peptidase domain-containing ABC transporter [Holosporaceae bacterium]